MVYKPILHFDCLNQSFQNYVPEVQAYLQMKKFAKPSPIQSQVWPPLLCGKDIVGIAATGTPRLMSLILYSFTHSYISNRLWENISISSSSIIKNI